MDTQATDTGAGGDGQEAGGATQAPALPPFTDYLQQLPETVRPTVEGSGIKDWDGLFSSFVHGQKMLGADKQTLLPIPKEDRGANPEAWARYDEVMGVPKEGGTYKPFTPPEGYTVEGSEEAIKTFDAAVAKAGVPQYARDAALSAILELERGRADDIQKAMDAEKAEGVAALQKEWGLKFPVMLQTAEVALQGLDGGEDFHKLMKDAGLDDHPAYLKLRVAVAQARAEDTAPMRGGPGAPAAGAMTPAEAKSEIERLIADPQWSAAYAKGDRGKIERMTELHRYAAGG